MFRKDVYTVEIAVMETGPLSFKSFLCGKFGLRMFHGSVLTLLGIWFTPDAHLNRKHVTHLKLAVNLEKEGSNVGSDGLPWSIEITCPGCSLTGTFTVNKGGQNGFWIAPHIIRPLEQYVSVSTTLDGWCQESNSEQFYVFNRILHILESRCCRPFF